MARIEVTSGNQKGQALDLDSKPELLVGRDPACDLKLTDSEVSGRHAQIKRTPKGYELKDLDSTNGTLVGGKPIKTHLLADGDELSFGSVTAKASLQAATRVRGTMVRPAAPRLKGADGKEVLISKETFLVGREKGCDLVLPLESVSARHAELKVPLPKACW